VSKYAFLSCQVREKGNIYAFQISQMRENPRHGWVEIIKDVKVYVKKTGQLKQAFVVAAVVIETH